MVSPVNLHFLWKQNCVLQALGTPAWLWLIVHSCHKGRHIYAPNLWFSVLFSIQSPVFLTQIGDWGEIKVASPAGVPYSSHRFSAQVGAPWFQSSYTVHWRRQWHPTPVLLPGKSHGRRSLVGCSPWGHEESDTTGWLDFHYSLSCIGEGTGNPLQCSCLENPRDGGAWWAAIYGVAQSRTRLKRLSSSSSSSSILCVASKFKKCFSTISLLC